MGQILSMMERIPNGWRCKICFKEDAKKSTIKNHVEANHTDKGSYKCNDCDGTFRTKHSIAAHSCSKFDGQVLPMMTKNGYGWECNICQKCDGKKTNKGAHNWEPFIKEAIL